jgi:hypothetical protein
MKRDIETGERVIDFLASYGRGEVEMEDLFAAVLDGYSQGDDLNQAYCEVKAVLKALAIGDMVRLSLETIPPGACVPRFIYVQPEMRKAAGGPVAGRGDSAAADSGRKPPAQVSPQKEKKGGRRKEDAVTSRFHTFVDLVEKKGKQARIGGEWNRLVSTIIYHDMDRETGFQSCVDAFINGLIWQAHRKQAGGSEPVTEKAGPDPQICPELLGQIDDIVRSNEQLNGELKGKKNRRRRSEADAPLTGLERSEIRDFMRCLNRERDEIQPGRLWQLAVSKFLSELVDNLPVYNACREAFRAGVVFQMHRKKLEA